MDARISEMPGWDCGDAVLAVRICIAPNSVARSLKKDRYWYGPLSGNHGKMAK